MDEAFQTLGRSRALWNRARLDLGSDEVLAQILDRGSLEDWRALYSLMAAAGPDSARLQQRIHALVLRVAIPYAHFWLAALASLGRPIDWAVEPPIESGEADI